MLCPMHKSQNVSKIMLLIRAKGTTKEDLNVGFLKP